MSLRMSKLWQLGEEQVLLLELEWELELELEWEQGGEILRQQ